MFWQPPCVLLNVCVSTLPMCCIMVHILYVVLKTSDGSGTLRMVFQWHPVPMSCRGPSGCSLGHFWGPSGHSLATHLPLTCYSLATHLPLTCHSLATHLLLTCYPLATHLPLTDLMWATKVSTIMKKCSKECIGKGMFAKFLPALT